MDADERYTGRDVTIAFLDSGFYAHSDLTEPDNRILAFAIRTGRLPNNIPSSNYPPSGVSSKRNTISPVSPGARTGRMATTTPSGVAA